MKRGPQTLDFLDSDFPDEGIHIDVMEIITGIKGLGAIEVARNRLDPYVVLFKNQIKINAYKQTLISFKQIERMIFLPNKQNPYAMRIYPSRSKHTYSFTILDQELLVRIFNYISARQITD